MTSPDSTSNSDRSASDTPPSVDVPQTRVPLGAEKIWRAKGGQLKRMGIGLLFLAVTLIAYFPVMNGQFIWDDRSLVLENRFIRSPIMLGEIFTHQLHLGSANSYYRPIQNVSFLIDYLIWGESSLGFHLTNILLQAASGWLLYHLLARILPGLLGKDTGTKASGMQFTALIVALLWTVHPIHNAAVAYISGRADPLSFALSAGAFWVALASRHWAGTPKYAGILLSAFLGLLALCTRESAACWMILFALYLCRFEPNRSRRECIVAIGALAGIVGIWLFLRHIPTPVPGAASPYNPTGPDRIVLIFRALGDYTRLLIAPVTLTMERLVWPEWREAKVTWGNFPLYFGSLGWLGFAVLLIAIAGVFWRARGRQLRVFGAIWFALCFLPISNLFPLNAQVAEHWMYLASVGAFLFATGCAITLPADWLRRVAIVIVAGFIPVMLLRTNLRAGEWADPIRFYSQTIEATGGNPRLINNLAAAYRATGDEARAEQIYRLGLKHYPAYSVLLSNLGKLLASQGRIEEANALLEKSQHFAREQTYIFRSGWHATVASARIKMNEGHFEDALALLESAREQEPDSWPLMQEYSEALEKVKGTDAAIAALEDFAWKQWWYKEPRMLLARMWIKENAPDKAVKELRFAAKLDVWDAQPFAEIAAIELERLRFAEALNAQRIAVRRAPKDPKQRASLASILHKLGLESEAAAELQRMPRQSTSPETKVRATDAPLLK